MLVLGIDPGLQHTGWGLVRAQHSTLTFIDCGVISTDATHTMPQRLHTLHDGILTLLAAHRADCAAVEQTFVNSNAATSLKLGQARGAILLSLCLGGLPVYEYAANLVKKSIAASGHAGKEQVAQMVEMLLPASKGAAKRADATDALAVAICHAHHAQMQRVKSS